MKNFTLKISPLSPFLSPVESDTLFGHICWAMEYLGCFNGSKRLSGFLSEFNKEPPLIMSGAFPEDYLPFPLLPPFTDEEMSNLENKFKGRGKGDSFDFIQWLKILSRQNYIALDTFLHYRQAFSKYDLYAAVLDGELSEFRFSKPAKSNTKEKDAENATPAKESEKEQQEEESQTVEVYHNAINRITGSVEEGKLFSNSSTFYKKDTWLDVYIKTDYFNIEELKEIFDFIGMNGFGADKSTGSGRFKYELKEKEPPFQDIEDFNAYLLLSNTNPSVLTKLGNKSFYKTQTKFGKLGGSYATNSEYSPYKNPVIVLSPGSVIISKKSAEFFGENFKDVHPKLPKVRHYGISYPIKMRLKNEVP
jgi:CRISPR-associated protein Csm4